MGDFKDPLCD